MDNSSMMAPLVTGALTAATGGAAAPLFLASAGASAAGNALQGEAANANMRSQAGASAAAAQQEMERQNGFAQKAQGVLKDTVTNTSAPSAQKNYNNAVATRTAAGNGAITGGYNGSAGATAPDAVKSEFAQTMSDAMRRSQEGADRFAKLGATNDANQQTDIALGQGRSQLGDINSAAQGSLALLPNAQRAAAWNAQKKPSGVGQLLSGLGSAGQFASVAGGSPSWSSIGSLFRPAPPPAGDAYWGS